MGGVPNASVLHFHPLIHSFHSQPPYYYRYSSAYISNESIVLARTQTAQESDLVVNYCLLQ